MAKTKATKKTTTKKTTAAKPKTKKLPVKRAPQPAVAQRVAKMTGGVVVGGNIRAGRDVVMGDQTNINDNRQQVNNITSVPEFMVELQKLQAQIAALKQAPELTPAQTRRLEVVEGDVQEVVAEVQKPKPLAARINDTLTGAQTTMTNIGQSVTAAVGLGTVLGGLAQVALKLFGG